MHTCKFVQLFSVSLLLSVLVPAGRALAKPPPATLDTTHALSGTVSLPAAASTPIDQSFVGTGLGALDSNKYIAKVPSQSLSEYLEQIARALLDHGYRAASVLPDNVAGLAIQGRSYGKGPAYTIGEFTAGNFPSGIDVAYQQYAGELNGNGEGIRFSPNLQNSVLRADAAKIVSKYIAVRNALKYLNKPNNPYYVTAKTMLYSDLVNYQTGKKSVPPDLNAFVGALGELLASVSKSQADYVKANLSTGIAVIGGHTNVSGVAVLNAGFSVSLLLPIGTSKSDQGAVGFLFSAQQEHVSLDPSTTTNVTQWGIAVALQDRVPSKANPYDRWQTLIGAEYLGQTALDKTGTFDVFARYRPYYRGKPRGYVPYEFTGFAGVGPTGCLFVGIKMGCGFSL